MNCAAFPQSRDVDSRQRSRRATVKALANLGINKAQSHDKEVLSLTKIPCGAPVGFP